MKILLTGHDKQSMSMLEKIFRIGGVEFEISSLNKTLLNRLSTDYCIICVTGVKPSHLKLNARLLKSGNPVMMVLKNHWEEDSYKVLVRVGRFLGVGVSLTKYHYMVEEVTTSSCKSSRKKYPVLEEL